MTAAPSSDPHSTAADTPELRAAAEQIAREAGLELVVLFGSVARGEARAEDLDLGVLGAAPIDAVDLTNRLTVLLGRQDVDVVDLRTADPVLLMQVAGEGNALFESTPARFNAFYSLAARRFADTKKFRDAERDWIEKVVSRKNVR